LILSTPDTSWEASKAESKINQQVSWLNDVLQSFWKGYVVVDGNNKGFDGLIAKFVKQHMYNDNNAAPNPDDKQYCFSCI
jgi:hypothetical protein